MEQIDPAKIRLMDDETLAALLEHALDPLVPITLFYAVLDCLTRSAPWYPQSAPVGVVADRDKSAR